ncbi:hypothetical protein JCM3765_000230 [Sporobolomyces pararoseus]
MGVHGLWSLLSPVARPITPESLKDKRLAVDASIWLYQFQMAIRDRKTGEALKGNHIQGTYRRILKLLHWGIKPVFVFDGDAPMLKKRTIEKRKRRKEGAGRDLAKTAQQLLSAQLRNHAAENALAKRRNASTNQTMDTGEEIGEDAVYLEDLEAGNAAPVIAPEPPTTPAHIKKARKDAMRDEYALPAIEGGVDSRVKMSDPRVATEEEFRDFIEDLRPEDLDINSDFFGNLPTEVKYEILGELRIKTRQVNHKRNQEMRGAATAIDFSRAQIDNLMQRNHYTQKLLAVTDELGTSAIAIPTRVAGTRNREYLLVKQDASKGGGWVLGVKNPELNSTEPITIETTTDESVGGHTDTDEFEEVGIDGNSSPPKAHLPTPDIEARRLLAEEAVKSRFKAQPARPEVDPYLDLPTHQGQTASHLFIDGNEDPELQEALLQSMETARHQSHSTSPMPPVASTSKSIHFSSFPQRQLEVPNPRTAGDESDDPMEYVEYNPPPVASTSKALQKPPSPMAQTVGGSDDSDAFEVVDVPAVDSRKPTSHQSNGHSAPPRPVQQREGSVAPPQPTLIDTVLLSDSDSEANSPRRSSPPLLPSSQPKEATPPAPDVTARDFGEEEFTVRSRPTPSPFKSPLQASHDSAALLNLRFADTASKFDSISKPLSPPIEPSARPRSPSPVIDEAPTPRSASPDLPALTNYLPRRESQLQVVDDILRTNQKIASSEPVALPGSSKHPSSTHSASLFVPEPSPQPTPAPEKKRSPSPRLRSPSPIPWTKSTAPRTPLAPARRSPSPHLAEDEKDQVEEEGEEVMLPWSRSPTPQPRDRPAQQRPIEKGPSQDLIDAAIAQASEGNLREEEEEYSEMARTLRNEELESMREDATRDMARLLEQRNAEQRNADGITRQMASEIKEMLILFGIPFLDAPQEAEAECASLLNRSLVDGVVTDDSDVFLFGASRVYRHMFDGNKYLECYLSSDLERELNLDRDKLVRLAYLLGGDYDDGLPGVGPVLARELLQEFEGEDGLEKFKEWWKKVEEGKDSKVDTNTPWKRKFKKGHKALVIEGNWPKPEIARAYYHPVVNESDEPFSWGGVDLDGLLIFLNRTMGWSSEYCMKDLKPLIDRLIAIKEGKLAQQKSLADFFDPSAGHDSFRRKKPVKYASERLQNVIKNWKSQQQASIEEIEEGDEEEEQEEEEPTTRPAAKKRKSSTPVATTGKNGRSKGKAKSAKALPAPPPRPAPKFKKSTVASRKKRSQALRDARAAENGGIYSSEEDLDAIDDGRPTPPPAPATSRTRRAQAPRETKKRRTIEPVSDLEE